MCGIFAVINDPLQNAARSVLVGLKKLEYRGYDSWGIAVIPYGQDKLAIEKHVGPISLATTHLPSGTSAIGHTRWATHGGVTDINSHPHLDCTGRIAVVHNGIVENYQSLKAGLFAKGHIFASETDTEVIAHLIEEESKILDFHLAVFKVFNQLIGSNAVVAIDLATNTIVATRYGSPLVLGRHGKQAFLASDITTFTDPKVLVKIIDDGQGVVLTPHSVALYDLLSGSKLPLKCTKANISVVNIDKAGHPHFLIKEILEQPITIDMTAVNNYSQLHSIGIRIKNCRRLIIIGCGSAYYCALTAKYFFANAGIDAQVFGAYEYSPFAQFCNADTVCLVISQSGETADSLTAARLALATGAYVTAIVNATGSSLERLADTAINVGAGPEIAVVSTKAFTSQLAVLYLISRSVVGQLKLAQREIAGVSQSLSLWLSPVFQNQIMALSNYFAHSQDIYLIGKHAGYPSALEFALKIKETSYIHAEAFASGELKHGVITLIQSGTPCIALIIPDKFAPEVVSSAIQLKARGGVIIGVAVKKSPEFTHFIKVPNLGRLTVFPLIIVGQMLAYYLGVNRGVDPDKPRNLAKSVTVK